MSTRPAPTAPPGAASRTAGRVARELLGQPFPAPLTRARELGRSTRRDDGPERLPTSLEAFDRLLAGGLPKGRLVELVGRRTSGRFSIAVGALTAATA
ncbi:MAG: hypothetical protein R3325_16835, partial [Thermoanaerobaculia bacterium]|nr:hypothetical protein [Thermoanaerobaculia bacterium]